MGEIYIYMAMPHIILCLYPKMAATSLKAENCGGILATEIPFEDFELAIFENKFTSLHRDAPAPQSVIGVDSKIAKGHCDVVVYTPEQTVSEAGGIDAVCPPFARFPYETYLVPRRAVKGPWEFTEEEAAGFAHLLGDMTRRYDALFGQVTPYMLSLHAAPKGQTPF